MAAEVRSDFLQIMQERGFVSACTNMAALDQMLTKAPVTGYIGYDATAPSLHVGHLVNIMMLRWFQHCGHKPIVLMGGGTTRIGDPSFRSSERPMLTHEEIARNMEGLLRPFHLLLDDPTNPPLILDNADWLDGLKFIDFLRDIGRHFSVNRMLSFDSVKIRLDRLESLSLLEFNYMCMQAYDFLHLGRVHGCRLQMGGSDQWGNIVNGIELARRADGRELFGLTTPLIETSDGKKMGKSSGKAIWLNPDMLSAYEFWQFWRNTHDADVGRFLKLFTELPVPECDRLGALQGADINEAKKVLADEVTMLIHGPDAAREASETAGNVFGQVGDGSGLDEIIVSADVLSEAVSASRIVVLTGLAASGKEAKRLIQDGAVRFDGCLVDLATRTDPNHIQDGLVVSIGKKKHRMLRVS